MTELHKAAEMALKLLENKRLRTDEHLIPIVIDDLRQALAQTDVSLIGEGNKQEPAPPRKPWVGLTDDEIRQTHFDKGVSLRIFARAIEELLKDRNT